MGRRLSAQLAATAGLVWLVPPLERAALVGPQRAPTAMGLLSEGLVVSLAAQIATAPLIVYHFGRLSAVSLLTNLLILPVQPLVMMAGGLATAAGLIWLLAWLPLAWTVVDVNWNSSTFLIRIRSHSD